jgi:hypothetical protein
VRAVREQRQGDRERERKRSLRQELEEVIGVMG